MTVSGKEIPVSGKAETIQSVINITLWQLIIYSSKGIILKGLNIFYAALFKTLCIVSGFYPLNRNNQQLEKSLILDVFVVISSLT